MGGCEGNERCPTLTGVTVPCYVTHQHFRCATVLAIFSALQNFTVYSLPLFRYGCLTFVNRRVMCPAWRINRHVGHGLTDTTRNTDIFSVNCTSVGTIWLILWRLLLNLFDLRGWWRVLLHDRRVVLSTVIDPAMYRASEACHAKTANYFIVGGRRGVESEVKYSTLIS